MNDIINNVIELTQHETRGNKTQFQQIYYNASEFVQGLFKDMTGFYDNGQELLIYNNDKIIYSCSYEEYYDLKIITNVYDIKGEVYNEAIDYDKLFEGGLTI